MAYYPADLKNAVVTGKSIAPQTVASATTTNGTAIDMQLSDGPVHLIALTGDCGDATLTLTLKLQESDTSGGTFTDMTGSSLVTTGGATADDNVVYLVSTAQRTKRWVRAVAVTAGGGTLSVPIAATVMGFLKVIGGNGAVL